MQLLGTLLQVLGSLGLFLFGMKTMSDGIQKASAEGLQRILRFMTSNRFAAVGTGFLITGLIQSSSATTVMVVGFVNAGMLSLGRAIGVIMGANIGTTVTGWIVALIGFKVHIAAIALPAIGAGLPLRLNKKWGKQDIGEALTGFGLLFLGLDFLKQSVPDIQSNPQILQFLSRFTDLGFLSFLLFIAVGTILTVIIQSSSAAMAITLTMLYSGWIDFPTAAAIVLGENIGTTATAFIASIGTNVNARRASRVHTLFNLFGVVWMAAVFRLFLRFVDLVVPGAMEGIGLTAHLAMFHTLFNVTNTAISIGFIRQLEQLVTRLVKPVQGEIEATYQLKYISAPLQDIPELNLANARLELSRMAEIAEQMYKRFLLVFNSPETKMGAQVEEQKTLEEFTDRMQEDISGYLAECARQRLNERGSIELNAMIRIAHEFENIGDTCYNLMILAQRRYDARLVLNQGALVELLPYANTVVQFITFTKEHLNRRLTREELETAYLYEDRINEFRNLLKEKAQERLQNGSEVKSELLYIDIVRHIEQIGDHTLNVAQALRQIR